MNNYKTINKYPGGKLGDLTRSPKPLDKEYPLVFKEIPPISHSKVYNHDMDITAIKVVATDSIRIKSPTGFQDTGSKESTEIGSLGHLYEEILSGIYEIHTVDFEETNISVDDYVETKGVNGYVKRLKFQYNFPISSEYASMYIIVADLELNGNYVSTIPVYKLWRPTKLKTLKKLNLYVGDTVFALKHYPKTKTLEIVKHTVTIDDCYNITSAYVGLDFSVNSLEAFARTLPIMSLNEVLESVDEEVPISEEEEKIINRVRKRLKSSINSKIRHHY